MRRKKYRSLLFIMLLAYISCVGSSFGKDIKKEAKPSYFPIEAFGGMNRELGSYIIDGEHYIRLRDLCVLVKYSEDSFNIVSDQKNGKIDLKYANLPAVEDNFSYVSNQNRKVANAILKENSLSLNGQPLPVKMYIINNEGYIHPKEMGVYLNYELVDSLDGYGKKVTLLVAKNENVKSVSVQDGKFIRSDLDRAYNGNFPTSRTEFISATNNHLVYALWGYDDNTVNISIFDKAYKLVNHLSIKAELTKVGGFFADEDSFYIMYGEPNLLERGDKEVYRIVKYNYEGKRMTEASLNGRQTNTQIPFVVTSSDMALNGKELVIHTNRQRLKTSDGLNHQSNLTIVLDKDTLKVISVSDPFPDNYVSHSMKQFVSMDNNKAIYADHGDAYPRSICVSVGKKQIDLFKIAGKRGSNYTGVELGGFEISDTHYIVTGSSIDQENLDKEYNLQNVFVAAVAKQGNSQPTIHWLSEYELTESQGGDGHNLISGYANLIKIDDNKMMVVWKEFYYRGEESTPKDYSHLSYVFIDGEGKPISEVKELRGMYLSEAHPVLFNNAIVWVNAKPNVRVINAIPIAE